MIDFSQWMSGEVDTAVNLAWTIAKLDICEMLAPSSLAPKSVTLPWTPYLLIRASRMVKDDLLCTMINFSQWMSGEVDTAVNLAWTAAKLDIFMKC
jgi:hypothetical protein